MKKAFAWFSTLFMLYGVAFSCIGFFSKKLFGRTISWSIMHGLINATNAEGKKSLISFFLKTLFSKNKPYFSPDIFGLEHVDKPFAITAFIGLIVTAAGAIMIISMVVLIFFCNVYLTGKSAVTYIVPALLPGKRQLSIINKKSYVGKVSSNIINLKQRTQGLFKRRERKPFKSSDLIDDLEEKVQNKHKDKLRKRHLFRKRRPQI